MIELEIDGAVARLTLNRPEARNALAVRDWRKLADCAAQVRATDARVLIVQGREGAFCAGADLGEFPTLQADPAAREQFRLAMREAMDAIAALPVATLAWIDGPCFGAGVALAMACDLRLAAPTTRFAITPAKMGIGYPQEDVARLVGLVGRGWAARLLFTGTAIDAGTAARIALVEDVADATGMEALVADLLCCDPGSIAMLKRGIGLAAAGVAEDADQDRHFDALLGSPALADRLAGRRAARGLPLAGT